MKRKDLFFIGVVMEWAALCIAAPTNIQRWVLVFNLTIILGVAIGVEASKKFNKWINSEA